MNAYMNHMTIIAIIEIIGVKMYRFLNAIAVMMIMGYIYVMCKITGAKVQTVS